MSRRTTSRSTRSRGSGRASSSRGGGYYYVFDEGVEWNKYNSQNLDAFLRELRKKCEDYDPMDEFKRQKEEIERDYTPKQRKSTEYQNRLKKLRYDTIVNAMSRCRLSPNDFKIPEAATESDVTAKDVQTAFNNGKFTDEESAARWVESFGTDDTPGWKLFNTNALKTILTLLKVENRTKAEVRPGEPAIGEELKRILFRKLRNPGAGVFGPVSRKGRFQKREEDPAAARDALNRYGIESPEELSAAKRQVIQDIAVRGGAPSKITSSVGMYNFIAEQMGWGTIPDAEEMKQRVKELMELSSKKGKTRRAREEAQEIPYISWNRLTSDEIKELAKQLQCTPPTGESWNKDNYIKCLMTGDGEGTTLREEMEERMENYGLNIDECRRGDPATVRRAAVNLGISVKGLSHNQVCRRLHGERMRRVASNIGTDTDTIKQLTDVLEMEEGEAREKKVRQIALTAGIPERFMGSDYTVENLIRTFLRFHYSGRMVNLAHLLGPDAVADYLQNGELPRDERNLRALYVTFSDLLPEPYDLDPAQKREQLEDLYNEFLSKPYDPDVLSKVVTEMSSNIVGNPDALTRRERVSPRRVSPRRSPSPRGLSSPGSPRGEAGPSTPRSPRGGFGAPSAEFPAQF